VMKSSTGRFRSKSFNLGLQGDGGRLGTSGSAGSGSGSFS
jgi:hypothetical protein